MHLSVQRSGGITGVTRLWSAEIPEGECPRWEAVLADVPQSVSTRPDERMYDITLGGLHIQVTEKDAHQGQIARLLREVQQTGAAADRSGSDLLAKAEAPSKTPASEKAASSLHPDAATAAFHPRRF